MCVCRHCLPALLHLPPSSSLFLHPPASSSLFRHHLRGAHFRTQWMDAFDAVRFTFHAAVATNRYLQSNLRARVMPGRLEPKWSAAESNSAVAAILVRQPCIRWLPAETILTGAATSATDVYSYSVLLWEIFSSNASSGGPRAVPYLDEFPGTLGAEGPGVAGGDTLLAYVRSNNAMPPMRFPVHAGSDGETGTDELLVTIFDACHALHPPDRPLLSGVATLLLEDEEEQSGISRWEKDRTKLTYNQKLGEGQFGDV